MEPFLFKLKKLPPHIEKFLLNVLPRFFEKQKEVSQFLEEAIQFVQQRVKHESEKMHVQSDRRS